MQRLDSPSLRATQCLVLWLLVIAGCARRGIPAANPLTASLPPFTESGDTESPDRWWTAFNDPQLDFQINNALENNYTLTAALQRVCAARALNRRRKLAR